MEMKFHCPSCDKMLSADPSVAGTQVSCPACSQEMFVNDGRDPPSLEALVGDAVVGRNVLAADLSVTYMPEDQFQAALEANTKDNDFFAKAAAEGAIAAIKGRMAGGGRP
jgi:hypothetical protein